MSAYVVDFGTIRGILRAAVCYSLDKGRFAWWDGNAMRQLDFGNANDIGQMLVNECVKSVQHRYPRDNDLPGRIDKEWESPFTYPLTGRVPTPVEAIKLVHCYSYQSCEHPEWATSNAKQFCDALLHTLTCRLPGYEEAQWGWDTEYANPELSGQPR